MSGRSTLTTVIACAVLLGILCSCSAGSGQAADASNPYSAQIKAAAGTTSSEYVRQILADGEISRGELSDAEARVVACLGALGIEASYVTNDWGIDNLTVVGGLSTAVSDEVTECQTQWMGPIDQLFWDQYVNPMNQDMNGLIAACLVRKGLAPAGFSGSDYANVARDNSIHVDTSTVAPDGGGGGRVQASPGTSSGDGAIPGGGNLSDPGAIACAVVPLQ